MFRRLVGLFFAVSAMFMLMCTAGCTEDKNNGLSGSNGATATVAEADLTGFWHYTSDYTEGMGAAYEFKSDGIYFYKNGSSYSHGSWKIQGNNILILTENASDHTNSYNVEYSAVDEATNGPSIKFNNQRFWKKDVFQDVIDKSPVYINLDSNYNNRDYQNKTAVSEIGPLAPPNPAANYYVNVIVHSDSDLYNFKISSVCYGSDIGDSVSWHVFCHDRKEVKIRINQRELMSRIRQCTKRLEGHSVL